MWHKKHLQSYDYRCSRFLTCGENGNPLEHLEGILTIIEDILKDKKQTSSFHVFYPLIILFTSLLGNPFCLIKSKASNNSPVAKYDLKVKT